MTAQEYLDQFLVIVAPNPHDQSLWRYVIEVVIAGLKGEMELALLGTDHSDQLRQSLMRAMDAKFAEFAGLLNDAVKVGVCAPERFRATMWVEHPRLHDSVWGDNNAAPIEKSDEVRDMWIELTRAQAFRHRGMSLTPTLLRSNQGRFNETCLVLRKAHRAGYCIIEEIIVGADGFQELVFHTPLTEKGVAFTKTRLEL